MSGHSGAVIPSRGPSIFRGNSAYVFKSQNYKSFIVDIYRGAAFLVACFSILFSTDERFQFPVILTLTLVGSYTLACLTIFHRLQIHVVFMVILFIFDVLVCVSLIAFTGGLKSPFFMYNLVPLLTVASFFEMTISFAAAGIIGSYILGTQIVESLNGEDLTIINFTYIFIYALFASGIAVVPFSISKRSEINKISESTNVAKQSFYRELHDGTAQSAAALYWRIQLLRQHMKNNTISNNELQEIENLAVKSQYEVRQMLELIRDFPIEGQLGEQLNAYLKNFQQNTGINYSLETDEVSLSNLDQEAPFQIKAIVQECLSNIKKHSEANNVLVTLKADKKILNLDVVDDGKGFEVQDRYFQTAHPGFGLNKIKQRCDSLSAVCSLKSAPGAGTHLHIEIPLSGGTG